MRLWLWLLLLVGVIVVGSTAVFLSVVFLGGEAGRSRLLRVAYPLYKYVFNPRTLRAAERGDTPYGVLHHIGRSSGATYESPVEAVRTSDGVIVPLMYGPRVDWCRNILAAGGCTLSLTGKEFTLSAPEVVPAIIAEPQLPAKNARMLHRLGVAHYLSLKNPSRVDLQPALSVAPTSS